MQSPKHSIDAGFLLFSLLLSTLSGLPSKKLFAAPLSGENELPLPQGLSEHLFKLPEALKARANQSLDEAIASYPMPDWAKKQMANKILNAQPDYSRMRKGALREFGLAQYLLHQGRVQQAVQRLHLAKVLSPRSSDIYRKLGRLYERLGDLERALGYYRELVKMSGFDAHALYVLGKTKLNEADNATAIALLEKGIQIARSKEESDLILLLEFQLAQALHRQGHDRAAVEMLGRYFDRIAHARPTPLYLQDFTVAEQSQPILHMLMGDSLMRLGKHAQAVASYEMAQQKAARISTSLNRRLVYGYLLVDRPSEAFATLERMLKQPRYLSQAVIMAKYLVENTKTQALSSNQKLIDRLQDSYERSGRPAALAIGISELKQKIDIQNSWKFLITHLENKPEDRSVYKYLLDRASRETDYVAATEAALTTTLLLLNAPDFKSDPASVYDAHKQLASELYGSVGRLDRIEKAVDVLIEKSPASRMEASWLLVLCQLQSRRAAESLPVIQRVFAGKTDWQWLVQPLVVAALEHDDGSGPTLAQGILNASTDINEKISVQRLLAQIAIDESQLEWKTALARLDKKLETYKVNTDAPLSLILAKAQLLQSMSELDTDLQGYQRYQKAIQYLGRFRKSQYAEKIYKKIFELQNQTLRRLGAELRADRNFIRAQRKELLEMAMKELPNSSVIHYQQALIYVQSTDRELRDAGWSIFSKLYAADQNNWRVLLPILELLQDSQRVDQARRLLEVALERQSDDIELNGIALGFYGRIGDWDARRQIEEKLLDLQPRSASRDALLADYYLRWGRTKEAYELMQTVFERDVNGVRNVLRVLGMSQFKQLKKIDDELINQRMDWLIEAFPESAEQIRYERAFLYDITEQHEQAIKLLEMNLPDEKHPASMNFLGYHYARLGKQLNRAEKLLIKAIDLDEKQQVIQYGYARTNPAFQDSLGWIYYKQGQFKKAHAFLEKAANRYYDPVILDHLGDVYWRLKMYEKAQWAWRQSQIQFASNREKEGQPTDPETEEVAKRISQKLSAVISDGQPLIAPVGASDYWQDIKSSNLDED